jgi:hypothetical protein
MKVNRWAVLTASCWVQVGTPWQLLNHVLATGADAAWPHVRWPAHTQASSGLSFSFPIIAPLFKSVFRFVGDAEAASLAAAISLGSFAALFSGVLYDALIENHNLGPR